MSSLLVENVLRLYRRVGVRWASVPSADVGV
jgi:hypothetical protein